MCKIKFWACSRDHLERSDWSRNIIGSFPRAEQLYIEMNVYGTTFHRGKSIVKYVKSLIIVDILSGSRNVPTECFPGSFRAYKGVKENIEAQSMATAQRDSYNRSCCPRPLTRRENDLEKDDEACRRKIHPR